MELCIQRATQVDIPAINQLLRASKGSWGYDEAFMAHYMSHFSVTNEYLATRVLNTLRLDSTLLAFFSFFHHPDGTLELERMYLDPHYFGHGYGRQLWLACCHYVKNLHKKDFIIWSDPHTQEFYRKMGCVQIGVRASPLMPDRSPPIFQYTLSEALSYEVSGL